MEFFFEKYSHFEERIIHSLEDNGIKHRYVY